MEEIFVSFLLTQPAQRELLIYNKLNNNWSLIAVKGGATSPRLINGWLVGRIKDIHPETNFETRKAFPHIIREEVVLLNPMENYQFTMPVKAGTKILKIDGKTVYYKTVDQSNAYLYKARIESDGFVDKELLSTDPVVRFFCWGFRGSSGK